MAYFSLFILSTLFAGILMPFSAHAAADNTNGSLEPKTSLVAVARPKTAARKSMRKSDRDNLKKTQKQQAIEGRKKAMPPKAQDLDFIRTFSEPKKGISFEYPDNWRLTKIISPAVNGRRIPTVTPEYSYMEGDASIAFVDVTIMREMSPADLRDLAMKQFVTNVEEVGMGKAMPEKFGSYQGFVSTYGKAEGEQGMLFFFTKQNTLYAFLYRAESKEVIDQFVPIFAHVLSSLKIKAKAVRKQTFFGLHEFLYAVQSMNPAPLSLYDALTLREQMDPNMEGPLAALEALMHETIDVPPEVFVGVVMEM